MMASDVGLHGRAEEGRNPGRPAPVAGPEGPLSLNLRTPQPDVWDAIREWFLGLGAAYGVDPLLFGAIYVGAIPFFTLSVAWVVRNLRRRESIVLPALSASFFFVSAYLYLLVAGRNIPFWVYGLLALMVVVGAVSTVRKIRHRARA